jgi:MinD superfamily P-loop ATPase
MEELVVISGKGGTGKTSIAGSLAALSEATVLADCDVDAANLQLVLNGKKLESNEFSADRKARIDIEKCIGCGLCQDICRFGAVVGPSWNAEMTLDPLSCEGCGVCFFACPEEAVIMEEVVSGYWFISDTPYGSMVHAELEAGEGNSGKLVTLVRNEARKIAEDQGASLIITDGPPGIGCPVIASLSGATVALIVTEPTCSGISDMERVLDVCRHFGVPAVVCINRYDLSPENASAITQYCDDEEIPVIGMVPFDKTMTDAIVKGVPVVKYADCEASRRIRDIWHRLRTDLLDLKEA